MDIHLHATSPPLTTPTPARTGPSLKAGSPGETGALQPPSGSDAIEQAANRINYFLTSSSSGVQFIVDGAARKVVVRVVDSQTQEVIRQMPSEEMVAISKSLDQMRGLLIKQKI